MRDKLTRAFQSAWPTKARMIHQTGGLFGEQLIEIERGARIVGCNVFANCFSVFLRSPRPNQLHG